MAKMNNEKVACQYCEQEYSKAGLVNHEKSCKENPDNIIETVEEPEVEVVLEEVVEEVVEEKPVVAPAEVLFDIKLKEKLDCFIGDRYYRFMKGEEAQVTLEVKNILKKAGLLEAI